MKLVVQNHTKDVLNFNKFVLWKILNGWDWGDVCRKSNKIFFWYILKKKVHAYDRIQYTKTILRYTIIIIIIILIVASV